MTPVLFIQANDNGTYSIMKMYSQKVYGVCKTYRTAVTVGHCIATAMDAHCDF